MTANLSQSWAKTSSEKACCRCNDEKEDGASTQRLATTTVLSALIVKKHFRLIAMVVGMRIVAHNGTELAKVDLYKHSVSAVQSARSVR